MRLATLKRHYLNHDLPFTKNMIVPDLFTFGGYGLNKVATGSLTTMFDAHGQIWYEAVMWGLMGEKLGLVVTDFQNRRFDWYQILRDSRQGGYNERMQMVISHNEDWHYRFLDRYEYALKNQLSGTVFQPELS
ncbi:hypothetical protein A2154_02530 [Candidatus Gottesmanbacteria bacterium RBG_16_43_7]|uniref:Uncharacterized protein n=1 Tax=Candidatus Gottesmanbacteria bacterium RBG_16_43_7 TaxID=1798373 RepID=A0A1F5ZC06_9BACT|nr:MAG: hypothetical protein A2154_02530 [Candidatus Gottesmanbacteria bacterium RBG_16_43_7]